MFQALLKRTAQLTTLGLGLMAAGQHADAGLILSYEAAGVQASTVAGVTTETFNGYAAGKYTLSSAGATTALGTLTGTTVALQAADAYGGAGNAGNYIAIGSQSGSTSMTLTLKSTAQYFGFWWSAADANNNISFYSGANLVGSFSASSALSSLGTAYNGNPNTRANTGEKYAYLNVSATDGTTFDKIVFTNASTGSGFESDNWSVLSSYSGVASGTVVNNGIVVPAGTVPEPSSLALVSIAGLVGGGSWLRGRRRANPAG